MTAGEAEGHPVKALADPAPDLDEPESQRPQLQMGDVEPSEPTPDRIKQPGGSTVQLAE